MTERIILDTDSAILRYHSDGIIHHEFKKRVVGKSFREILDEGVAQMIRTKATKWLSDDRKHTVLDEDDEKWAHGEWFKKAVAAGWKYWAVINPEKAVGQMQTARHAKTFELGGIKVAMFSTPEQGLEWLRHIDAQLKKTG
ncbi:MAG: hypothetical protein ACOZQL_09805 [Myxococcota bacterium]